MVNRLPLKYPLQNPCRTQVCTAALGPLHVRSVPQIWGVWLLEPLQWRPYGVSEVLGLGVEAQSLNPKGLAGLGSTSWVVISGVISPLI